MKLYEAGGYRPKYPQFDRAARPRTHNKFEGSCDRMHGSIRSLDAEISCWAAVALSCMVYSRVRFI